MSTVETIYINHVFTNINYCFIYCSWNNIKKIGPIFDNLPFLKTFKVEYNDIVELKEGDWKKVPDSLKYIDIGGKYLHKSCYI